MPIGLRHNRNPHETKFSYGIVDKMPRCIYLRSEPNIHFFKFHLLNPIFLLRYDYFSTKVLGPDRTKSIGIVFAKGGRNTQCTRLSATARMNNNGLIRFRGVVVVWVSLSIIDDQRITRIIDLLFDRDETIPISLFMIRGRRRIANNSFVFFNFLRYRSLQEKVVIEARARALKNSNKLRRRQMTNSQHSSVAIK